MKHPLHIQAEPAPFPEDVESPVAMAIPIPEEGIYVALVIPKEAGLEAMGSYSGIHARGTNLLHSSNQKNPVGTATISFKGFCRPTPKKSERSRPSEPVEGVDARGAGTNLLHIPK